MWRVGHSLIKARMRETGALLAGEVSGHIFMNDRFFGYDDAPYVGARLLELLSHADFTLDEWLNQQPKLFATPEIRVHCLDHHKKTVVDRVAHYFKSKYDVVEIDGVRMRFPEGWGLVRPSNTQPVLVMRFEASSEVLLTQYQNEIEQWIIQHAPEVDLEADTHH